MDLQAGYGTAHRMPLLVLAWLDAYTAKTIGRASILKDLGIVTRGKWA